MITDGSESPIWGRGRVFNDGGLSGDRGAVRCDDGDGLPRPRERIGARRLRSELVPSKSSWASAVGTIFSASIAIGQVACGVTISTGVCSLERRARPRRKRPVQLELARSAGIGRGSLAIDPQKRIGHRQECVRRGLPPMSIASTSGGKALLDIMGHSAGAALPDINIRCRSAVRTPK